MIVNRINWMKAQSVSVCTMIALSVWLTGCAYIPYPYTKEDAIWWVGPKYLI